MNALGPVTLVLDTNVVVAADQLIVRYRKLVYVVTPQSVPSVVAGDADDDHVLALAVAARASLIVSGDRAHLLPLGRYAGIAIITPREAMKLLD